MTVRVMGPPRPGPKVVLEILAPSVRVSEAAVTWIMPAAPAVASRPSACATMPLETRPSGLVPARVRDSVAVIVIVPPRPGPKVELEIRAPSVRVSEAAVTWIVPAAPAVASRPSACATMPLEKRPSGLVPARVRDSVAVIVIVPPRPGPKVMLEIRAPSVRVREPAVIVIVPPRPGPEVELEIGRRR